MFLSSPIMKDGYWSTRDWTITSTSHQKRKQRKQVPGGRIAHECIVTTVVTPGAAVRTGAVNQSWEQSSAPAGRTSRDSPPHETKPQSAASVALSYRGDSHTIIKTSGKPNRYILATANRKLPSRPKIKPAPMDRKCE